MPISIVERELWLVLKLEGRFDFSIHSEFEEVFAKALTYTGTVGISVDLGRVTYMDSSAIGMLLDWQERSRAAGINEVTLKGASGMVKQILGVAHLERFFKIE